MNLKRWRKENGFSQSKLADELSLWLSEPVSQQDIARLEKVEIKSKWIKKCLYLFTLGKVDIKQKSDAERDLK